MAPRVDFHTPVSEVLPEFLARILHFFWVPDTNIEKFFDDQGFESGAKFPRYRDVPGFELFSVGLGEEGLSLCLNREPLFPHYRYVLSKGEHFGVCRIIEGDYHIYFQNSSLIPGGMNGELSERVWDSAHYLGLFNSCLSAHEKAFWISKAEEAGFTV